MANRLGLNSSNSSKPPSSDPNREKKKKDPGQKKPGGQKGHNGITLQKCSDPDFIEKLPVDKTTLPAGNYKDVGFESRQVIDIDISRVEETFKDQAGIPISCGSIYNFNEEAYKKLEVFEAILKKKVIQS